MIYRKILFLILALLLSVAVYSQDENETVAFVPKNHSLTLGIFPLLASTFQMNYEYIFSNSKTGIQFSPMLILKKTEEHEKDGYGGELQLKLYLLNHIRDKSMQNSTVISLYIAPYVQYATLKEVEKYSDQVYSYSYYNYYTDTNTYVSDISSFAFGGLFGMKLAVRNAFVIEPFLGLGVMSSNKTTTPEKDPNLRRRNSSVLPDLTIYKPGYTGIYVRIGFLLGAKF